MRFHLYFAGSSTEVDEALLLKRNCCRLFSQLNEKSSIAKYKDMGDNKPELLIDSGAFSVAHSGAVANMEEHIDFINQNDEFIEHWVEMDDICMDVTNKKKVSESADRSWENYLYYLDKIKSPEKLIPVFHHGEPREKLERILNTPVVDGKPAPYIGISRVHVGACTTQNYIPYFNMIFDCVEKSCNKDVKIHAFGITALNLLEHYPFYSADSTSWIMCAAFGSIMTKYGTVSVSDQRTSFTQSIFNMDKKDREVLEDYIKKKGYKLEELSKDYRVRRCFNIDYMQDWADNYEYKPVDRILQNSLF